MYLNKILSITVSFMLCWNSDLAFFALILAKMQKYHRCESKGINDN